MAAYSDAVRQLRNLVDEAIAQNKHLATSYENFHQGFPEENLLRFLKAREYNVSKAFKMIMDCLHWRVNNDIDNVLAKPILPKELYDAIRDSHLVGMTGFCKQGRPVFALGVGLSGFDKAPLDTYVQSHIQINEYRDRVLLPAATKRAGRYIGTCLKILDMSHLKLSALNRIKILTMISTVDDLNYPEKTDVYYIVNAPYIFAACWKVVKPLLQERTKTKVHVLQGCGKDELLKVMDYDVLPHFCKPEMKQKRGTITECYSSFHPFHIELWNYMKQRSYMSRCVGPAPQRSYHVEIPEPGRDAQVIQSALVQIEHENGSYSGT